jgi:GT2 family glycosyltransferase
MPDQAVTIAVVPRERFSSAVRSLESIYANTREPFRLVYVDGGSPARLRGHLREQSQARGFKLLRAERYLSPNEARNLALRHVETEYVVFVDNDATVAPGWLDALLGCAEETGAWVVGALVLSGEAGGEVIHHAGGETHIEEVGGRRLFVDGHPLADRRAAEVGTLSRERCERAEFHCLLVRAETLRRLGGLDEGLLSIYELEDFCMAVCGAGGSIYFEPGAVAHIEHPPSLKWSDMPYYLLRWSDAWNEASLERFREKWRLAPDDPGSNLVRGWATQIRQSFLWRLRPSVDRFTGGRSYWIERRLLAPLESRASDYFARRDARARAQSGQNFKFEISNP